MVRNLHFFKVCFFILIGVILSSESEGQSTCDPLTPSHIVDLSASIDSFWISPSGKRKGLCCDAQTPDDCVEFLITLNPGSNGIRLDIETGAEPTGAMFYQVECGNPTQIGDTMCLTGVGPHRITFCKPGNNPNSYRVTAIPGPSASPPIAVSNGCSGIIYETGYDLPTVVWTSIPFNATYNSYMSCSTACDTVLVTAQPGYPDSVNYEVSGQVVGGCTSMTFRDTVTVYFITDKTATILPQNPTICFGGTTTSLTANGTGGAPPYSYQWSTGETTQSISVGAIGDYWVIITDTTDCPPVSDTVTVTAFLSPILAMAGAPQILCSNNPTVNLAGSVQSATGGIWSGGLGTYNPADTVLNAIYTPTAGEISSGSLSLILTTTGNGSCAAEKDTLLITFTPSPVVVAGNDTSVCSNNRNVQLNGSVSGGSSTGIWTSSGTGTFSPDDSTLNAVYTPSDLDTLLGSVYLKLSSTNNGNCTMVEDSFLVTITDAPSANAGSDKTVCVNNAITSLNGIVTVSTGGIWTTTGDGIFSPDPGTLSASYSPGTADTAQPFIYLILTTSGNGQCIAVFDSLRLNFTSNPQAIINAGLDETICANDTDLALTGTVPTTGLWSTSNGNGVFLPNDSSMIATYIVDPADTSLGTPVLIILTTTNNGTCAAGIDTLNLTINPGIYVNAGPPQVVCADTSGINLNGSVSGATGGIWTSLGSGTFLDSSILAAVYIPSAGDTVAGTVDLILTSTGNGLCNAVSDTVTITITPAPIVNAGLDIAACSDVTSVNINGSVFVATGGNWSTSGTGGFTDSTALSTQYLPSALDTTGATPIVLYLRTTGMGQCNSVIDSLTVTFTDTPVPLAGADLTVCGNNNAASLNGIVGGGSITGIWTASSGSGNFAPNDSALNAVYTPSAADTTAGSVFLILTSTNNGGCGSVSDSLELTITDAPVVDAGANQTVCSITDSVTLAGSMTILTDALWTTTGSGSFIPSSTVLNPVYLPSSTDQSSSSIKIFLTGSDTGFCNPVMDSMILSFTPEIINIVTGNDTTICGNDRFVSLNSTFSGSAGVIWSTTGTGGFTPSVVNPDPTYTISDNDTLAGGVILIVETTGNGGCPAERDSMVITIRDAIIINISGTDSICANESPVVFVGSVSGGALTGQWISSGTGTFLPSDTSLTVSYVVSPDDTSAGNVTLELVSTNNNGCAPVSVLNYIEIEDGVFVNAGSNASVCATNPDVSLSGSVITAAGGIWTSSSGLGVFNPSDSDLTTVFTPSATDIANGNVTLYLESTGNGNCNPVIDSIVVTFTPDSISVDAGNDTIVCGAGLNLNGMVQIAGGGRWSTSGDGSFSPNDSTLTAFYLFGNLDSTLGSVQLNLTTIQNGGCSAKMDSFDISIFPVITASITTMPDSFCTDGTNSINIAATSNTGTGAWTSSSGGLNFIPSEDSLITAYTPSSTDSANGIVTLIFTTTNTLGCADVSVSDSVKIKPAPMAGIAQGASDTVCSNISSVALTGSVSFATGGKWITQGTGSFLPSEDSLIVNYVPSTLDTSNGSVIISLTTIGNSGCKADTIDIQIVFEKFSRAIASADSLVCETNPAISLSGAILDGPGGIWSTFGDGGFSLASTNLVNTYNPGTNDIITGSVDLVLSTTNVNSCSVVRDTITITITPDNFSVNAGNDTIVCGMSVPLNGSVVNTTGWNWSTGGTGNFNDTTLLDPVYNFSTGDSTAGTVPLYFTVPGIGGCASKTDSINVSIYPPLTTSIILIPDSFCMDGSNGIIIEAISSTGTGIWTSSSGGTGFFPSSDSLSTSYIPSTLDSVNGQVALIFSTTNLLGCVNISVSDTVVLKPAPQATISGGAIQNYCSSIDSIPLSGVITNEDGGRWVSSGTGSFFPSVDSLNTNYLPSSMDTANGVVDLLFITNGNSGCKPDSANLQIVFEKASYSIGGSAISVCVTNPQVNVNGQVIDAPGGTWSTTGDGNFTLPLSNLTNSYNPGPNDVLTGNVQLILTTTNTNICAKASDTVEVTITPDSIMANAGNDTVVCSTGSFLNGFVYIAGGGRWTTSGNGIFLPNDSTLNGFYQFGSNDTSSVELVLTTIQNGGCLGKSDTVEISIPDLITVNIATSDSFCSNMGNLPVSIAVSTGSGAWSSSGDGAFIPNVNALNANYIPGSLDLTNGSFNLYFTSSNNGACAPTIDTFAVNYIAGPSANAGLTVYVCETNPIGNLSGLVQNAGSFKWFTTGSGNFTPSDVVLSPNYNADVTDVNSGTVQIFLEAYGNPSCPLDRDTVDFIINKDSIDVFAGNDTSSCAGIIALNAQVYIATGANWDIITGTGSFLPNDSVLNPVYTFSNDDKLNGLVQLMVTTTGNGGCTPKSDTIEVLIPGEILISLFVEDDTICFYGDSIPVSATVSSGSGFWTSSGTGSFIKDADSLVNAYLPSGNDITNGAVDLIFTSTNNGVCNPVRDTITLTLAPGPLANAGTDVFVCKTNSDATLSGISINSISIQWTGNGTGVILPNDTSSTIVYQASPGDIDSGSVEMYFNVNGLAGCRITDTISVFYTPDSIEAIAGNDSTVCSLSVLLNGQVKISDGGYWITNGTGSFSPSDSILNPTYTFSPADTLAGSVEFILITSGNKGCQPDTDSITIFIKDPILVNITGTDEVCNNDLPVDLSGSSSTGSGYWISGLGGTFSPDSLAIPVQYNPSAAEIAAGTASVYFVSLNNGGCVAVSDTLVINLLTPPDVKFGFDNFCENAPINFVDLTTSSSPLTTWVWDFGDGSFSSSKDQVHTYFSNGVFNVLLTVTDENNCSDTSTIPISIQPGPVADFTSNANCFRDSVLFLNSSTLASGNFTSLVWNFGDGFTGTGSAPYHNYSASGIYNVSLFVETNSGCKDTIQKPVNVIPSPTALFEFSGACQNDPTVFNDLSIPGTGAINNWAWDFGDGGISVSQSPQHIFTNFGTFQVSLVVTSSSGCKDTITIPMIANAKPVADFAKSGHCLNEGIYFRDSTSIGNGSITSWSWTFGDGNVSNLEDPYNKYLSVGNYPVTLVVQSDFGCSDTVVKSIVVDPSPTADFITSVKIAKINQKIYFTDKSVDAVKWHWDFGDNKGESVESYPSYTYDDGKTYTVIQVVENIYGCTDTAEKEIIVTMPPKVPDAFSPNGDGKNDILYPMGGPYLELEFVIYNNWGEVIFISNREDHGWNGKRDGVDQPIGVYVFTLRAITEDKKVHKQNGDVTLLR